MMKISKKKHLEIALQNIPQHPHPKIELEQYLTPAPIAADILWNAHTLGDIKNKKILDLACGTGIFTIGSALLKSEKSIGIDIDPESLNTAQEFTNKNKITNTEFLEKEINTEFNKKTHPSLENINTAIQNPPFGSQARGEKGKDRIFIEKAAELSQVIYSFHMAETEDFITKYFEKQNTTITHKFHYKFTLPHTYPFHTQENKQIKVIVIRAQKGI